MQEFTIITEPAETGLFVVLADVGREVRDGYGADVCGCFDGADGAGGGVWVFGDEGCGVGETFVGSLGVRAGGAEEVFGTEGVGGGFVVPVYLFGCVVGGFYGGASGGDVGGGC